MRVFIHLEGRVKLQEKQALNETILYFEVGLDAYVTMSKKIPKPLRYAFDQNKKNLIAFIIELRGVQRMLDQMEERKNFLRASNKA